MSDELVIPMAIGSEWSMGRWEMMDDGREGEQEEQKRAKAGKSGKVIIFTPAMKETKHNKLLIKNMVCQRCVMTVEHILRDLGIPCSKVTLGEAELPAPLTEAQHKAVDAELRKVGFELIETRVNKIIEDIKKLVLEYLTEEPGEQKLKLSSFITNRLHYDYSYLSDLFSSIEGTTIEQFFIVQRIEKVKELLVYDELSLTEIAWQTGFSSVHHLSAQFKKVTGLTPSHFKKIGAEKRKSIDAV